MGWLDWLLLGGTSESDSLETRMEMEVNREVEDRKKQARDRDIRRKAIDVVKRFGGCTYSNPGIGGYDGFSNYEYKDEKILTSSSGQALSLRADPRYGSGEDSNSLIVEL